MLHLSSLIASRAISFTKSGMVANYFSRDGVFSIELKENRINIPLDITNLEIVTHLNQVLDDARRGDIRQNAWENPEVKDLQRKLKATSSIVISYYILMMFLQQCQTRDLWFAAKNYHHSLLSYLRNRTIGTRLALQYKVALLSCHLAGYKLSDLSKVERTFKNCGLSEDNSIFYILMLLDGYSPSIKFDKQPPFVLSVDALEEETRAFIDNSTTKKYAMSQAAKKLRFIATSNKLNLEDLANELIIATQIAYQIVRPFKTKAYSENYARRAMTNTCNRIIASYTKHKGKVRLVSDGDTFANTHFSLDSYGWSIVEGISVSTKVGRSKDHNSICPMFQGQYSFVNVPSSEDDFLDQLDLRNAA